MTYELDRIGKVVLPPQSQEAKGINMALEYTYGRDVNADRPKFRLSWSTLEKETRYGVYSLYYMQHIFLRDEVGYVACSKYPDYPDRWVLETLVYAPVETIPETKNGHYEPVYIFRDKKQEYLPPLFHVCSIVINAMRTQDIKSIIADLERLDATKLEREIAYFEDILEDTSGSWLVTAMRDKEAVVVPKNYEKIGGVISSTKGEL